MRLERLCDGKVNGASCDSNRRNVLMIKSFLTQITQQAVEEGQEEIPAKVVRKDGSVEDLTLYCKGLTADEKQIILDGCLMNYYAAQNK